MGFGHLQNGADSMGEKSRSNSEKRFTDECRMAQEFCIDYMSDSMMDLLEESIPDPYLRNIILAAALAKNYVRYISDGDLDEDGEKCKECVEEYVYSQGPKTDSDGPEGFEGVDASAPTDSAKAVPTIDKKISPYVSSIIRLTKTPGSPYESRVMYSISFPKMTE